MKISDFQIKFFFCDIHYFFFWNSCSFLKISFKIIWFSNNFHNFEIKKNFFEIFKSFFLFQNLNLLNKKNYQNIISKFSKYFFWVQNFIILKIFLECLKYIFLYSKWLLKHSSKFSTFAAANFGATFFHVFKNYVILEKIYEKIK